MPKRGQRRVDTPGRNDPTKSQEITTGTYKKQETYREEAALHEDPGKVAQHARAPHDHPHQGMALEASSQLQTALPERRSGSDSNAHSGRKGSRVHESRRTKQPEAGATGGDESEDYDRDLRPHNLAGQNVGIAGSAERRVGHTAADLKELYGQLGDFTTDELRAIQVMPEGTRLEQGAVYLDLRHRDRGEFVATGDMAAGAKDRYVAEKETDYVTWNRLIGVTTPARLDQPE